MTTERATKIVSIGLLNGEIDCVDSDYYKAIKMLLKSIEHSMSLKALEQEPCGETVSLGAFKQVMWERDIAIEQLKELGYGFGQKIEPKTGHWIGHREHCENLGVIPSGLGAYKWCSNCDCGIDVSEWHRNNYKYCPNCGARMESEDKE